MSSATKPFALRNALVSSIILCCLIGALPARALAWGDKGHRIVARIAERNLTPQARSAITSLISNDEFLAECRSKNIPTTTFADKFACIATWADKVRPLRPQTSQWHFVDIPRNADQYDAVRDCSPSAEGDCVVQEIVRAFAVLSNQQAQMIDRAEALKFIVHFVGDMHQPLHDATDTEDQEAKDNGFPTDRGGNQKFVRWLRKTKNPFGDNWKLHAVWDAGIIDATPKSEKSFASGLNNNLSGDRRAFTQPSALNANWPATLPQLLVGWANDGHELAVQNAYGMLGRQFPNDIAIDKGKKYHRYHLNQSYLRANKPIVDDQLTLAGVRLARILNEALR
jgi:hypothetical protein